jgi:two-component system LytT family sensor kinase
VEEKSSAFSMRNPILAKSQWLIGYLIWWILPGSIHLFVLQNAYSYPMDVVLFDSFISFILLALLGLSLWYLVRYSSFSKAQLVRTIRTLFLSMLFLFVIWAGLSYLFLSLYTANSQDIFVETGFWRALIFLPSYLLLMVFYALISFQEQINDHQIQEMRIHNLLKETELNALKSQINPHFLFNSLNSASSLTLYDPPKAHTMIVKISDYFRGSLMLGKKKYSTLQEELDFSMLYLEIEKARFGDKFSVAAHLPDTLQRVQIPSYTLQPLVENAIKHGVYESSIPIKLDILVKQQGDVVVISFENNLDPDAGASTRKGTGTGLRNVEKRLQLAFGGENVMSWTKSDHHFKVEVRIPMTTKMEEHENE